MSDSRIREFTTKAQRPLRRESPRLFLWVLSLCSLCLCGELLKYHPETSIMKYLSTILTALTFSLSLGAGKSADQAARGLDIDFTDREGGAGTLIVRPAGESIRIDCGNPGTRDAERIHTAAKAAGLKAIDHLIITHWHLDHYGGIARLAELIPIHHYYDHGIPDSLVEDPQNFPLLIQAYKKAAGDKRTVLKPGDEIPLKQKDGSPPIQIRCLCGGGEVIAEKNGAAANPVA